MKHPEGTNAIKVLAQGLERKKSSLQQSVLSWSDDHPLRYPWRKQGTPAYRVLIGELLLDKAGENAVMAYEVFLESIPSVNDLLGAGDEKVGEVLAAVHLQHHRESFRKLVQGLAREGKGDLPRDTDTLGRISGLARYRVKAVFCFGYGLPIAVVDPHVFRMLAHIFASYLPPEPSMGLVEAVAESLVCYHDPQKYNGVMLDLAELVCRPGMAQCSNCPVNSVCDSVPGIQKSSRSLVKIG